MNLRCLAAAVLLALPGCSDPGPTNVISIKGQKITVEHYRKDPERRYAPVRHSMVPDDRGFLCSWNRDRHLHYFSEASEGDFNVLFLDEAGKILEILPVHREETKGVTSSVEARRALFLHEGWAGRNGLKVGDSVDLAGARSTPVEAMPVVKVGGHAVHVELAGTYEERQRGLMHRPRMSADDGMLFMYPGESGRNFWMKNTLIALDIAYFDSAGRLVAVRPRKPAADPATGGEQISAPSGNPAQFVLEVNHGWFAARKIIDENENILTPVTLELPGEVRAAASRADP